MSVARVRSKTGCLTCKNRRKKCDETRPVCERCTKAKMKCLGYAYLEETGDASKRPRPRPTAPVSPPADASRLSQTTTTSVRPTSVHTSLFPTPNISFNDLAGRDTSTTADMPGVFSNLPNGTAGSDIAKEVFDFSFLSSPAQTLLDSGTVSSGWWDNDPAFLPLAMDDSTSASNPQRNSLVGLTPTSNTSDVAMFNPPYAASDAVSNMTGGQASLFQALFSLGQTEVPPPFASPSSHTSPSSHASTWSSPDIENEDADSETSEESDVEGVKAIICPTLTLDRNTENNSLPFVLQSHAEWIARTLFEPLRIASRARDHIIRRFARSDTSRWTVVLTANVTRTICKAPTMIDTCRPAIAQLRDQTQFRLDLAALSANAPHLPVSPEAADALFEFFEAVSIHFASSNLQSVYNLIKNAAPDYRQICSEPFGSPINLPHKLLHSEFSVRHFPALDVLFSLAACAPTQLQYDVTPPFDALSTVTDFQTVGLQWANGVPDEFVILLARIHILRAECTLNVDLDVVRQIEQEIQDFQPIPHVSPDPFLTISRLGVQEAWRQTLYIYLYMGLCGVDASDSRVVQAVKSFTRLLRGIKPGRNPDAFLIVPMIVSAVASCKRQDRELIRGRLLGLREWRLTGTCGRDTGSALLDLWARLDAECRPAMWRDWRTAMARYIDIS